MHCPPALLARIGHVRTLRMRMAEMALAQADQALDASRAAERQAQEALARARAQGQADAAAADTALLTGQAGGRLGIGAWQAARRRAQLDVQRAQGQASDAVAQRLDRQLQCTGARTHWRDTRLSVERLQLLAVALEGGAP